MIRIKWEKPKRQDSGQSWIGSLLGRPAPSVDKYGHTEAYYREREKAKKKAEQKARDRLRPREKTFLFGLVGRAKPVKKKQKVIYVDSRGRVVDPPRAPPAAAALPASSASKRPVPPTRSRTYDVPSTVDKDRYRHQGTTTPQKGGASTPQRSSSTRQQGTSTPSRQGTSASRRPEPPRRSATTSNTHSYSRRNTS